jgi:hypothetical protein
MNMGRHVGGFAGRLLRPPGWPLYVLTAVAVLLSLWAAAFPMPAGQIAGMLTSAWERGVLSAYARTEVRYAYAVIAWLVVAAVWTARRLARGVTVRRIAPGQRAAPLAYWRRWLIPHFVLLATVLFCRTPAPVYVGFWVSKPWINAAQRNWTGNPPMSQMWKRGRSVQWVGIYPTDGFQGQWASYRSRGMNMVNVSDYGGFVQSPGGPPSGFRGYDLRYVGGGWYSFHKADVYR